MIINKLNECLNSTNENDINHIIARFIKINMSSIPNMKIDEIAEKCYVSKGKVSNFCKQMGYDSFSSLKYDCIKEKEAKKIVAHRQELNLEKEYLCHLNESMNIIKTHLEQVNLNTIHELVQDIEKANQIFLYGVSYSHLLCQYFQYECEVLNKDVIVLDEKLVRDYQISKKSILIVITIEGYAFIENPRLMTKLKAFPSKKWIISTDIVSKEVVIEFEKNLLLTSKKSDLKDRRILIRYLLDIVLGRFQHLYL